MANQASAVPMVRCLSCGSVDAPVIVRGGPGWVALMLWLLTLAFWAASWYVTALSAVFWIALLAALIYTLWYFYKKERACRSCGSRDLGASQPA
ncbi:MAG: hypothetical protein ACRELD_05975 [Longimicrobiales bacterium]